MIITIQSIMQVTIDSSLKSIIKNYKRVYARTQDNNMCVSVVIYLSIVYPFRLAEGAIRHSLLCKMKMMRHKSHIYIYIYIYIYIVILNDKPGEKIYKSIDATRSRNIILKTANIHECTLKILRRRGLCTGRETQATSGF